MRLAICRDGRVLIREHGEADRMLDNSDPFALAEAFRSRVELEEGLTGAQLFRALRPWAALLSRAAWMDFDTWQASASRAPLQLVTEEPGKQGDDEPPLDAVVIHPVLSVHRDTPDLSLDTTIAVHWRTSGRYAFPRPRVFGGEDRFCSLSFAPPASWAHLSVLIDSTIMVDDYELFREALPTQLSAAGGQLSASPSFFDTIVLGFLDDVSFHGTPQETAEFGDELARRAAEISSPVKGDPP